MFMLFACGADEKDQGIDNEQLSDAKFSTDEMVATEDEFVDNGYTDADEIPDEDLAAKYNMTYVGNTLRFTLLIRRMGLRVMFFRYDRRGIL